MEIEYLLTGNSLFQEDVTSILQSNPSLDFYRIALKHFESQMETSAKTNNAMLYSIEWVRFSIENNPAQLEIFLQRFYDTSPSEDYRNRILHNDYTEFFNYLIRSIEAAFEFKVDIQEFFKGYSNPSSAKE